MDEELSGKVAVVTGGGSGIGRAIALSLARRGAAVVVADIDPLAADGTVQLVRDGGGDGLSVATDVGRADQVEHLVQTACRQLGGLDVMCNNAGISGYTGQPMAELDEATFDAVVRTNLKGVWLGIKYAVPAIVERGGGCIVNIASTQGLVGLRLTGPYSATKHAVIGLTKSAALEYGRQGVRVNAVCPGGIDTPIGARFRASFTEEEWQRRTEAAYPATGRYGRPEEVGEVVAFLCSDAASNIHGVALPVDGGYTAQ